MLFIYQLLINIDLLMTVETSPTYVITSPNSTFTMTCTARAEVDGQGLPLVIVWTHICICQCSACGTFELKSTEYTTTGSPESGYQSILTTTANDTIVYRCTARVSTVREFNDTIVIVHGMFTQYTS